MAASNTTAYLGLNSWLGSDKPTRSDFVHDNVVIDNKLGEHLESTSLHFTGDEKKRVNNPFSFKIVQGSDTETRTITMEFEPKMAICFALDTPAVTYSDNTATVNSGIAVAEYGGSGGIIITERDIRLKQATSGNIAYNLNNSDFQYVLIAFR